MIPVWFISLLLNRFVIGGIVAAGLLLGAYFKGYHAAREACQEAALRAQIAAMQRDIRARDAADEVERRLQADLQAENLELQQKVTDYETSLATRPDNRCLLTPDDVRSLDGLSGKRQR